MISFQVIHNINCDIGVICVSLFISASNLFLYCYFGEQTTQNYITFGDLIYESEWRRLPIHLQKPLIMMIAVAQLPLQYHGFGLAYLNLNTFLGVIEIYNDFLCRVHIRE